MQLHPVLPKEAACAEPLGTNPTFTFEKRERMKVSIMKLIVYSYTIGVLGQTNLIFSLASAPARMLLELK